MADEVQLIKEEIESFIDSLPEEPKCIYNRTIEERKKFCKYCSAACDVRVEEEPASDDLEEEISNYIKDNFLFRCWQMGWLNKYDNDFKKKLVIIMDSKEGDTKHICNQESCPFYSKTEDGDMGILCKKLWATPPKGKPSSASLCNYYNVQNLTIAEAEGYETINQILKR